jgi:prepilin-type N-terminal cleavage/methylation domain-containing protein
MNVPRSGGAARGTRARRGYTLIELLVVISVLGIAGAMVIPALGQTNVLRVQAAVRTIISDINYAQSDALARQASRAVVFDVANNTYSILEVHGQTLDPVNDTIQMTNLNLANIYHDTRLVSAAFDGTNVIVFDELGGPVAGPGSSNPGAGGSIVVGGSGSQFRINVEAYTGRTSVTRLSGP